MKVMVAKSASLMVVAKRGVEEVERNKGGVRWVLKSFCDHAYLFFVHLFSSILASTTHHYTSNPPPKTIKNYFQK